VRAIGNPGQVQTEASLKETVGAPLRRAVQLGSDSTCLESTFEYENVE